MKHYTKEELELYRNGQMSLLGRIHCTAHLKECGECAKRMAELKEEDTLLADLRSSLRIYRELSSGESPCPPLPSDGGSKTRDTRESC